MSVGKPQHVLHPPQAFFILCKQLGNTCHRFNARIPAEAVNTNTCFPAVTGEMATGNVGVKHLELWVFHKKRREMGEGTLFGKPEAREWKTTAATQVSVSERLESRFCRFTYITFLNMGITTPFHHLFHFNIIFLYTSEPSR
jgi:hypothetical protein